MEATRRILKKTCQRIYITFSGKEFVEETQYVVECYINQGWETELYSNGIGNREPAIFECEEKALAFVNGEFGKETEEVVWTNAK